MEGSRTYTVTIGVGDYWLILSVSAANEESAKEQALAVFHNHVEQSTTIRRIVCHDTR